VKAVRPVLADQPPSISICRQCAHLWAADPCHRRPGRRVPPPRSLDIPSNSRTQTSPERVGTGIALLMGRPGGRAMLKITSPLRVLGIKMGAKPRRRSTIDWASRGF
jgi:hypothetical protein